MWFKVMKTNNEATLLEINKHSIKWNITFLIRIYEISQYSKYMCSNPLIKCQAKIHKCILPFIILYRFDPRNFSKTAFRLSPFFICIETYSSGNIMKKYELTNALSCDGSLYIVSKIFIFSTIFINNMSL